MTNKEAADILQKQIDDDPFVPTDYRKQLHEAFRMAIKALKHFDLAINALEELQVENVSKEDYPLPGLEKYDLIKIHNVYFVPLYQVGDLILKESGVLRNDD